MVDDLKTIKERIYNNGDLIRLLEELECLNVRPRGNKLVVADLPARFKSNRSGNIQIKNNSSLTADIWTRQIKGDIFAVVGYIEYECETFEEVKAKLFDIKRKICQVLGYTDLLKGGRRTNPRFFQKDYNKWLRAGQKAVENVTEDPIPNHVIEETVLDQYDYGTSVLWANEGISHETQMEFEVGFDPIDHLITFAVRNTQGDLIGIKGRYVGENPRILADMKYYYLYPCNKSIELFNLHRALPYILAKKEIIIVEGAKTVMLLYEIGVRNVVSIEGDRLTNDQLRLIKGLGIGIRIIGAWDKDKDEEFVEGQLGMLPNRLTYYIMDSKEEPLLSGKDSPMDKGAEVWQYLYENNIIRYKNTA